MTRDRVGSSQTRKTLGTICHEQESGERILRTMSETRMSNVLVGSLVVSDRDEERWNRGRRPLSWVSSHITSARLSLKLGEEVSSDKRTIKGTWCNMRMRETVHLGAQDGESVGGSE